MPYINSKVSFKMTSDEKNIIKADLGKAIELIPGKSEEWLMVGFEDDCSMYFKGEAFEKIAFIEVKIFGSTSQNVYRMLTSKICDIYEEVLKIPKDKIYVKYEEVSNWGWNGGNF